MKRYLKSRISCGLLYFSSVGILGVIPAVAQVSTGEFVRPPAKDLSSRPDPSESTRLSLETAAASPNQNTYDGPGAPDGTLVPFPPGGGSCSAYNPWTAAQSGLCGSDFRTVPQTPCRCQVVCNNCDAYTWEGTCSFQVTRGYWIDSRRTLEQVQNEYCGTQGGISSIVCERP